jgi:long-chain acyl-CoA synthetase
MSFIEQLHLQLARMGDAPAVTEITERGPEPVSAKVLATMSNRARTTLDERGVQPGDRVVLIGPNSARWVAADLAILAAGGVVVPMYDRQAPAELAKMMLDCTPGLVIVATDALRDAVLAAWPQAPVLTFQDLFAATPSTAPRVPRGPDDLVTLIYTSGTSGEPKGVMTTRANVDHMLPVTSDALTELMGQPPGEDRVFHYLPFCFAGSRVVLWTSLYRGTGVLISTDLDRLVDEIGVAAPHYFLNVPVLLERVKNGAEKALKSKGRAIWWLYQRARQAQARKLVGKAGRRDELALRAADRLLFRAIAARLGPNLRFLICGSAPLGEDTQRWFELIGVKVYQVYGLTETTAIVTMDRPDAVVPGRVGSTIRGCEARTSDEGELLVRGPHIFQGYWKRPDATEAAFLDGWFRTGDQCTVDDAGNWAVVGRVKNLLVPTSGHNVAPEPIEQRLTESITGVEQAVLIGHGRPHLTALFTGAVDEATLRAGVEAVNAELPFYKRIRAWHHRPAPLTPDEGLLTANGKLKRAAIEAHFADAIHAMYARGT